MKRISLIVMVWTLALAATGCSASRSTVMSEADLVTAGQIDKMLTERLYKVDFDRAYPMSAPTLPLNYPYFVSVIGNRVESFLPYFGRAFTIPYGGGEGLRFEAPISDYRERVRKNGSREISFRARTNEDRYDFTLTVFPLGQCDLNISPGLKQPISFSGEIDLSPEFEAVRVR